MASRVEEEITSRRWYESEQRSLEEVARAVRVRARETLTEPGAAALMNEAWRRIDCQLWREARSGLNDNNREELLLNARRQLAVHLKQQRPGSHDALNLSVDAYLLEVLGFHCMAPARGLIELSRCCGRWSPYPEMVIFQHRHSQIHRDSAGRLHRDGGPALAYRDGFAAWALHGVLVPRSLAETPDGQLDPRTLVTIRNAEVRREFVRKVGIERICYAFQAKAVDRRGTYELLILDLGDGRRRPYLKMLNPSIGTWHVEGVSPHCRTVAQALAWRDGEDVYVEPDVLT